MARGKTPTDCQADPLPWSGPLTMVCLWRDYFMKYLRFYENLFKSGDVFTSYFHHTEKGDFWTFTVKTHRGYYTDKIHVFKYWKHNTVNINITYFDNEMKLHTREFVLPYENFRNEMLTVYDEIVNG